MGLGVLFGALSGAGKGLAESAEQSQKVMDEKMLMQERARLEEEKVLRIEQVRTDRTREAGIKQGQDIESGVRRIQDERISSQIQADEGPNLSPEDVRTMRDKPSGRALGGLLNSTRRSDLEDRASAAMQSGYLEAAKEYRSEARDEARDVATNRRLDAQEKSAAFAQRYQMRREARMDKLASSEMEFRKSRATKDDARSASLEIKEQRAATSAALRSVNDDIKSLLKESADPMLAPEQKVVIDGQLKEARSEAARYRESLAAVGVPGSKAPPKEQEPTKAPPDGTRLRKGGNTYIVRNGIPVLEGK